ncbi:MAG: c-type cytochrome [Pirellulaceae bacterium]
MFFISRQAWTSTLVLSLSLPLIAVAADVASVERKVTKEDMPRIPHTDPQDVLKTFKLADGFSVELVAAEPLVGDPVDACFDEFGRMFVAEMHGYPFSQEPTRLNPDGGGLPDAGIIRMLEDTDGDGRMDKSVVFADKLSWPTSLCCYNGGVFVVAPKYLLYFKDTDGDGKADVREEILSGFGRDNVQAVTNGLKWDLDNRIYFAAGRNPMNLQHRGKALFPVSGSDLRLDPKTETFEPVTGGSQFGHSMDDWGTRFVCSNSDHIQQVVFPRNYLERNPYFVASGMIRSIAADGASARVFRISPPEPWRIIRQKWRAADKGYKLVVNDDGGWEFLPLDPSKPKDAVPTEYPIGFFTSATGVTIYRGDAYPERYRGNAFVGDVGGNLVHRKSVNSDRVVYQAKRADEGEELLASTDNWFRPVNFVNAPDGSLYVLDMYRETVEHPHSIPEEIKKFLYLTSGNDRGRIYRLVSPEMKRRQPLRIGDLPLPELVEQLASTNGWNRETAQRLIWERQDKNAVALLRKLLRTTDQPLGRLHALYSLAGLDSLSVDDVAIGLVDAHPRVRAHAIRLSEPFIDQSPELLKQLVAMGADENEHVRFQLAFTLGQSRERIAIEGLAKLARRENNSPEVITALMSSVGGTADQLAASLIVDDAFMKQKQARSIIRQLGLIVGATPAVEGTIHLLTVGAGKAVPPATQELLLSSLGEGLKRRGSSFTKLLQDTKTGESLKQQLAMLMTQASDIASDESRTETDRQIAIGMLAQADLETAIETLSSLLEPQVPHALQRSAVASLAQQSSDLVATALLKGWRGYTPDLRRDVLAAIVDKPSWLVRLLDAYESGAVKRSDIGQETMQVLIGHPDKRIAQRSKTLLSSGMNTNRAKVVAEHQDVLSLEGDRARGMEIFKQKCAVCHQVGQMGHQVAPSLESVKNKSNADLLIAILDPNREAQPNFNTYVVQTIDGRVLTGMIGAESASSITLKRAEGKEDVILRSNIELMQATGVSLMPEGFENDLKKQDLADVISFVKSIQP